MPKEIQIFINHNGQISVPKELMGQIVKAQVDATKFEKLAEIYSHAGNWSPGISAEVGQASMRFFAKGKQHYQIPINAKFGMDILRNRSTDYNSAWSGNGSDIVDKFWIPHLQENNITVLPLMSEDHVAPNDEVIPDVVQQQDGGYKGEPNDLPGNDPNSSQVLNSEGKKNYQFVKPENVTQEAYVLDIDIEDDENVVRSDGYVPKVPQDQQEEKIVEVSGEVSPKDLIQKVDAKRKEKEEGTNPVLLFGFLSGIAYLICKK